jgi:hypothetical protein
MLTEKKIRADNVPPVLILTVCAISARFSTHPKLNDSPAFLRGEEWAKHAREIVMRRYDWPNITILTCLLLLGLHEFGTCQGGRSWSLGGMAIRMAFALQLHQDLDYDPQRRNGTTELSFVDREIRRRTMWACFLMDRFNSSGTERPTFIKEETIKVQLPIKEKYFQLDMPGPTEDLWGGVPHPVSSDAGELSNAKENMGVAAYMIRVIAIWGRIINYLNLGGRELDPHPVWHPDSKFQALSKQAQEFADSLPASLKYTPENLHMHETEGLANQYLFLHVSIPQNTLFLNKFISSGHPCVRGPDVPKDFVPKCWDRTVEAANRVSEILQDAESYLVAAPFTGYCAFLSSGVHLVGIHSKNPQIEALSKHHLAVNIKYLQKMKRYWGMFHFMSESLKDQYRVRADNAHRGLNGPNQPSTFFQYGDWFNHYPHGVTQSDFEDPVTTIKKEKGDDAVLEQKSDYRTVEEFFHTLSPSSPSEPGKGKKKAGKKGTPNPPMDVGMQQGMLQGQGPILHDQMNQPQAPNYHPNQISPSVPPANVQGFYNHDMMMQPQHGMMPQLDRQLVFGAYAGMEQISMPHGVMDGAWDMNMNMGAATGWGTDASSAWFMPFNMEPPELGDSDVFSGMQGLNYLAGMGNDMGQGG